MSLAKEISISKISQNIFGLLQSGAGFVCLVDTEGTIHALHQQIAQVEGYHNSIFHILPEYSFQLWKKTWAELKEKGALDIETSLTLSDDEYHQKKKLKLILLEEELALFVCTDLLANTSSSTPVVDTGKSSAHTFNYDDYAPHHIFYVSEDGFITYMNPPMYESFKEKEGEIHIDTLFLETDLGPPLHSWKKADIDKETVFEMVMKAPEGFMKGYARITKHKDKPHFKGCYRVEFLNQRDLRYYGNDVEGMREELDKMTEDLEFHKELLIEETVDGFDFEDIVTQSPVYKEILAMIAQVADTNATVLISGETGTGKELLCNSIFRLSDRSDKVMVKINCGSIPPELMESVFFGHEKGAFTGADKMKIGKFELANGGTIFLDEIGELPLHLQPKLLRVLQEGEIERVGNPMPIKVDVRIIAATNRDLEQMVKEGTFRADLFYRLNVFPIYNIPLRERKEDIPLLVKHFIRKSNKQTGRNVINISKKDYSFLMKYDYPGNIRELENIIERGVILAKGDTIDLEFLKRSNAASPKSKVVMSYEDMQKKYFSELLTLTKGKVSGSDSASDIAGVNNKTLTSKLKKLGIDPKAFTN